MLYRAWAEGCDPLRANLMKKVVMNTIEERNTQLWAKVQRMEIEKDEKQKIHVRSSYAFLPSLPAPATSVPAVTPHTHTYASPPSTGKSKQARRSRWKPSRGGGLSRLRSPLPTLHTALLPLGTRRPFAVDEATPRMCERSSAELYPRGVVDVCALTRGAFRWVTHAGDVRERAVEEGAAASGR